MSLFDRLYSIGVVRKTLWKLWYPFLTRRLRGEELLFLNYAFDTDPPMGLPLAAADEPYRAYIQLYHHVTTQVPLAGKNVLEVSCGHGGGASYLVRTLRPQRYVGLDLNPKGIAFCRKRHVLDGLTFVQGDAEKLAYPENTFDAVVNIEASHCYPLLPRFLAEVTRVLRPGGHFLYADFRFAEDLSAWDAALANSPLRTLHSREINAEVLRGMDWNAPRSLELITRHLPKFTHALGRDFAGVPGSRIYTAIQRGDLSYRSYCLMKPATA